MIINVLIAILLLSIIIVAHEFGHFIVAKANGVCVVEFSIGFGPRLFGFRKGDTDYCIKALPFGGSCRMLGAEDYLEDGAGDEEDEDGYAISAVEKRSREMLKKYGESRTLEQKSVSARIAILAAGPLFNFLFALIASVILIGTGGYDPCTVDVVREGTPAYEAGLREGDLITSVNGRGIHFAREFNFYEMYHEEEILNITYKRNDEKFTAVVQPREIKDKSYKIGVKFTSDMRVAEVVDDSPAKKAGLRENDKIVSINGTQLKNANDLTDLIKASEGADIEVVVERAAGQRSLTMKPEIMEVSGWETGMICYGERVQASPIEAVGYAFCDTGYRINTVIELLGRMLTGRMSVNNLSGPVGTVSAISDVVGESRSAGPFYVFLNIMNIGIMLSANLGIMNLLPVPALDGGKLIVYIIEAIRGKAVDKKVEAVINFIGVVFLLVLTAFILVKDIVNLF